MARVNAEFKALCVLALAAAWAAPSLATPPAQPTPPRLKLHVPSPDWRDQVIYFLMTDRFADGDPRNNDQGTGEFKPVSADHFQGGDLKGVAGKLDYIRGLGATAVWITPPVANQWLGPGGHSAGYHGYWGQDFSRVDRHLGTLADYQRLSDRLHRAGMFLVQDIVLNHTGDYFWYDHAQWRPADPTQGYHANDQTPPSPAPTQWPFSLNDPRRAADRRAGIYHWTPNVADYADRTQELAWQMSGLDDLNTDNPVVRRALRQSYGHWVRAVGVDAFRVDTAFYVPEGLFTDFLHARDPQAPGINPVARQTGRRNFFSFGEGFGIDAPGEDRQTRKIEGYTGAQRLPGMLNFPLYGALGEVFARGRPTVELAQRISTMMTLHHDPHRLVTFVDNHDVDRFLAGGSEAGLRQALLALMTLPGIPALYYGTEQGFTAQRAAMFSSGQGPGGRDRFNTDAPLYRYLRDATALRKTNRLFSRGVPTLLASSGTGPGALAWRTDHAGRAALVVFNTAEHETLLDHLATGLPEGTVLEAAFGIDGRPPRQVVGAGGELSLALPPRAGLVWWVSGPTTGARKPSTKTSPAASGLTLDALPAEPLRGAVVARGSGSSSAAFQLVLNGDLARAPTVQPAADGRWLAEVDTSDLIDPHQVHTLVAWRRSDGAVSAARNFRVERAWTLMAEHHDPADDDTGPNGRYQYPSDPSFAAQRSMDLRQVRVRTAGGAMEIELRMAGLSRVWNPPHGFDHLALSVFIELPGLPDGATALPFQAANLPEGMRWHRRLRVHGWRNALFSNEGAGAAADGTPLAPAATVAADAARQTITLTLPSAALGRPLSLSGAKVYVSTWDYDGGYRPLAADPAPWAIGGGDPVLGAKVMDDTPVITLP